MVRDIRFWIVLFFVIHLVGITTPPLEMAHSWRQTTVAMVARNYYEVDNNLLYPRLDIGGEKTGITGMEFPFLNYLMYGTSLLFGYSHWYGRLINLVVSCFGLYFFYLLVQRFRSKQESFYATLVLAVSIWFVYSRKIMPDTFSVSLIIISLYYGTRYLIDNKKPWYLLFYGIFACLGLLSKVPAGILLGSLVIPVFMKRVSMIRKVFLVSVSIVLVVPFVLWYFWWVPTLVETFGLQHFFMGCSIFEGWQDISSHINLTLYNFYHSAFGYSGFLLFAAGLVYCVVRKDVLLLMLFVLTFIPLLFIILKSGDTFYRHSYYIVPFVPTMSLFAGYFLAALRTKWVSAVLVFLVFTEMIVYNYQDFRIKSRNKPFLLLETELDKVSDKNELIVINSGYSPAPMYFAHRKGWVYPNDFLRDTSNIDSLKRLGCKKIVVVKEMFGEYVDLPYRVLFDDPCFTILSLE